MSAIIYHPWRLGGNRSLTTALGKCLKDFGRDIKLKTIKIFLNFANTKAQLVSQTAKNRWEPVKILLGVPYKTPFVAHPVFHDRCRSSLVTFQATFLQHRLPPRTKLLIQTAEERRLHRGVRTDLRCKCQGETAEDIYIYTCILCIVYIYISSCENAWSNTTKHSNQIARWAYLYLLMTKLAKISTNPGKPRRNVARVLRILSVSWILEPTGPNCSRDLNCPPETNSISNASRGLLYSFVLNLLNWTKPIVAPQSTRASQFAKNPWLTCLFPRL